MELTSAILKKCLPFASEINLEKFLAPLNRVRIDFEVNTEKRMAAFLAQIAHESGSLKYVEEIASGDAYDTRTDLGNTPAVDGDGRKWKGRGLIQITGLTNYLEVAKALGKTKDEIAAYLLTPMGAALSAGWFWQDRGLNELADQNKFLSISVKINGRNRKTGLPNGWEDRQAHWERCKVVLGVV